MAGAKEIRTKIKSVKSTQKITKAMEKVAASKLRRTQGRMAATRPYADKSWYRATSGASVTSSSPPTAASVVA